MSFACYPLPNKSKSLPNGSFQPSGSTPFVYQSHPYTIILSPVEPASIQPAGSGKMGELKNSCTYYYSTNFTFGTSKVISSSFSNVYSEYNIQTRFFSNTALDFINPKARTSGLDKIVLTKICHINGSFGVYNSNISKGVNIRRLNRGVYKYSESDDMQSVVQKLLVLKPNRPYFDLDH